MDEGHAPGSWCWYTYAGGRVLVQIVERTPNPYPYQGFTYVLRWPHGAECPTYLEEHLHALSPLELLAQAADG